MQKYDLPLQRAVLLFEGGGDAETMYSAKDILKIFINTQHECPFERKTIALLFSTKYLSPRQDKYDSCIQ